MKISLVIPSFNEKENIRFIYGQIIDCHLEKTTDDLEIIFVDDGSRDGTFADIRKLAQNDARIKGLRFSRNFGKPVAILAGLKESSGDLVVTLDADGQHPPALIPELILEQKKGFEIINTRRDSTSDSGWYKKFISGCYYRILNFFSEVRVEPFSSDFRLMTRDAVNAFLDLDERNRYTNGLVSWIGFRQSIISYKAPARHTGKSKFNLRKLIRLGMDGITSFSTRPVKISFTIGLIVIILGLIYAIYAFFNFFFGHTTPGWTSLMIVILLLGGIQLLSLGIIGEYISRIFNESKRRPHYFLQDRC
jgi:glycosyltransferase involved in cell wall biosynthesis